MAQTIGSQEEFDMLINKVIDQLSKLPQSSIETIGLAIWDVFSNNNIVVHSNGSEIDPGSWREASGSIANAINTQFYKDFDSSDFFQGTESSDLRPVDQLDNYTEIFLVLHEMGCDWRSGSEIEFNVCVMDGYIIQAYKSIFKK